MKLTLLACMMAVAAVSASPPPQVGGPNCVYPSSKEARCNANQRVTPARAAEIRVELFAYFDSLAAKVLRGDIDGIVSDKMADCKFDFGNDVQIMGKDEIRAFELGYVGAGGKVLTYSNLEFLIASETRAIMVGGDWSLDDGMSGKFGFHDFYKQDDGTWKILFIQLP